MIDTEEFLRIKKVLADKKSERDKLIGKKDGLMEQLKEYGYSSIDAAEKAIEKIEKEINKMDKQLIQNINKFKDTYGDLLWK